MVEGDVVHHCDAGLEKRNRAVALVHFTDENLALADPGAGDSGARRDEVLHIGAVHDRRALSGAVQNPSDHADRGGLTARAGDANAQAGRVEEFGEKPRAGGNGGTVGARLARRGSLLNSRRRDQDLIRPAMPLPSCGWSSTPRARRKSNLSVSSPWSAHGQNPQTSPPLAWTIKASGSCRYRRRRKKVIFDWDIGQIYKRSR